MKRSTPIRIMSLFAALALVMTACGRDDESSDSGDGGDDTTQTDGESASLINTDDCIEYKATQGVDGNTIKIGTVRPATGNFAIFDKVTTGLEAWVNYQNANGGVTAGDGQQYQIELVKEDDAYDPAQTPGKVQKLVEQDGVFAIVGQVGTANNLAVRDYMNDNCVPSIALATGSPMWGDAAEYPWYIGGLPSYATEAKRFVDWLKEENPEASIALLYQDDDLGKAFKDTIESEIEGTDMTIADEASFNPLNETTTEAKVSQLAASNADVFFVGISGVPCTTSLSKIPAGWDPITYVGVTCSSNTSMGLAGDSQEGVYTSQFTLDPSNPTDREDPRMIEYIDGATSVGMEEGDITGGISSIGWGFGAIFGAALEGAGSVTRADVMDSIYSIDDGTIGIQRDEVAVNTDGIDDPWLLEDLRIAQRTGGVWVEASPNISYEGMSNEIAGI